MKKTILAPAETQSLVPTLRATRNPNAWVYRYEHPNGWRLSIATHAEPGSDKLSLGGFRIAPEERTSVPGFDSDVEAIELAMGMEEKVYWSRIIGVGGPLARRDMNRIVGGKCVLHPAPDARVGQRRDQEMLDFAATCLTDCDMTAGIRITTGQDLGHGVLSDGKTQSLAYLHRRFRGSVVADTSKPTGEGNYFVLRGMLRAFGIDISNATVGLIGGGNIGLHIAERLRNHGTTMIAVEARADRRAMLHELGAATRIPDQKEAFLAEPIDALVVNASGGSLDADSVQQIARNPRLRVICGSENLVMPNPADAGVLRAAGKAYCPTELGGMMGYLTAVEQYLAELEHVPFDVQTLFDAAAQLEEPAFAATRHMIENQFAIDFETAVEAVCT
ncbi:MAG TPA: hypothetical protein VEB19_17035 [Gemmatimonadaceae bacterium]|nr:hypothetical protein [Gemmatimonadaceae bacterium]